MKAATIIGHEAAGELLRRSLAHGHVGHAYLFAGPAGIGKFALARRFAQTLVCSDAAGADATGADAGRAQAVPCGVCRSCRLVATDRHPDVRIIQMPDEKREISIDQIRTVQHEAALKPYEAPWKVYIVRDAEAMSEEAANCLLKTLEEPPPQVVLILTSPTPEALLPTIVSRCQTVPMHALPVAQVEAALASTFGCEPERARLLARLSAGRIGWAIQAAEDEAVLAERGKLVERLVALGAATRVDRLAFAYELSQRYGREVVGRVAVHAILDLWSTWWRDVVLTQEGCADRVVNADRLEMLRQEAGRHSARQARLFLDALTQAGRNLRQNVNPRLALEVLALAVPRGEA